MPRPKTRSFRTPDTPAAPFGMVLVLLLLVACGGGGAGTAVPEPERPLGAGSPDPAYLLTVEVGPDDTREAIEARYGGSARVWIPEAVAVLGVDAPVAGETVEENRALFLSGGERATMNGSSTAWAGGSSTAWAGGSSNAWAGGNSTAWAGGVYSWMPENTALWQQIRLQQGHEIATHLGRGVTVAVIDTGVDLEHPALREALAPADSWWDFVGDDAVPREEGVLGEGGYGHGTNVAGIVRQVAPRATILPIRVLGPDGSGNLGDVAEAIRWAQKRGAQVINLSLGSDEEVEAIEKVIDHVTRRGVFVVASTGNSGDRAISYPAATAVRGRYDEMRLSVTSVDGADRKSDFATFGAAVELAAPGEAVYGPAPDERMAAWSGTSMAAPMAAGALALALGETLRTPSDDLGEGLKTNAFDHYADGGNDAYGELIGRGRLDAERFLDWAVLISTLEFDVSDLTVAENEPIGSLVGSFVPSDADSADGFAYRLVAGAGDADNALFRIVGDRLETAAVLDFEAQASYSVRVRAEDGAGGSLETTFTVAVENVDEAPTGLDLSDLTVLEEQPIGSLVGSFTTTDVDSSGGFSYRLVAGDGDSDNARFRIVGDRLETAAALDFEARVDPSVRVRVEDAAGGAFERAFVLRLLDLEPDTLRVTSDADSGPGSLRRALLDADAGDTVLIDDGLRGSSVILTSGELVLDRDVTIRGRIEIGADRVNRLLKVLTGATVVLEDVRLIDGSAGAGGAIYNEGELILQGDTRILASSAVDGGGVYNAGTLTLRDTSRISGSFASGFGGGVFTSGAVTLEGDSRISGNSSFGGGGGVYIDPTGSLTAGGDAEIGGNSTAADGGGVYNAGALTLQANATIRDNTAGDRAGGVYSKSGTLLGADYDGVGSDNIRGNAPDDVYD